MARPPPPARYPRAYLCRLALCCHQQHITQLYHQRGARHPAAPRDLRSACGACSPAEAGSADRDMTYREVG